MKIGIIVYSRSGHTLKAARRLQETLVAGGHQAELQRLETTGLKNPNSNNFALKSKPSLTDYDAVVFCSPVHGGVPARPILRYLDQLPEMKSKQAAGLVTHFFPRKWGADQTLSELGEICESKGAIYRGSGDVRWLGLGLRRRLTQAAEDILHALN